MKKLVLASLTLLFFSGCYQLKKDNMFIIRGSVQNASGQAVVVQAQDGYRICVDVDYTKSKGGVTLHSSTTTDCAALSTDPQGNFQVIRNIAINLNGEEEKVTINNAKLFVSKSISQSSSHVYPVSLETINLSDKGGDIKVKATVF